ncbi:MAG TPA: hypothetical protein VEB22_11295 [Phycisphaerales bacterium]|nr:hypothetical protein [Phycisphaerales bacterium]
MTPTQVKIAVAGGLALVAWLLTPRRPGRRTMELEIDANVYSPTFGLPIGSDPEPDPRADWNPELRRLVEKAERLIATDEAEDVL